ncbi:uncharacterized protein LOC113865123 [Abrus precatorius]|uniref:Uncharacterized protein LOC113865123 n=1 Tax=Abrus precatorius TaxID=3816 RepID=A0A8B8LIX4_ABRPR|nr:uncharacterized protein LOC113865123 [Abrus precatorius]
MQIQPTIPHSSMETHKKKNSSSNSFSFPSTPNQDSDFEFGSLTPDSPSIEPFTTSPADQLFLNGRLLPHSFPLFQHQHNHPTSRTSSINSSKDSFLSSRSNSTNSSCSSARTSSSDTSESRLFHNKIKGGTYKSMVSSHYQAYGRSQRWQYITPVPVLNRDGSMRTKRNMQQGKKKDKKNKKKKEKLKKKGVKLRFGRRIFRWFVMACRECHAMEPSKVNNKEI